MIEDILLHDERLRLECVAQAVASGSRGPSVIIKDAKELAGYISENDDYYDYDENTLNKVYASLQKAGFLEPHITNAVHAMQNAGILFRERTPSE